MKISLYTLALSAGLAASAANAKDAKCLLAFEGEIYMNGPCSFEAEANGSFWITSSDKVWSAAISVGHEGDPDYAYGAWNSDGRDDNGRYSPANRLHGILGELKRNGACWSNRDAVVCAWQNLIRASRLREGRTTRLELMIDLPRPPAADGAGTAPA